MTLHHVNFHTLYSKPIFEVPDYDIMIRACLREVLRERRILCLAWEVMPTHAHMIIEDFPDYVRSTIMQHVKGDTARAFFRAFPDTRADLLGGHLWNRGYFAAVIPSHAQFCTALNYVRANRQRADLPPPIPLQPIGTQ
jgi:putative transposase